MYKTKNNILLILVLLLMSIPSHAQFKLGVTAGLNISQLHVSDDTYKGYINKIRPGFIVGPTVIYNVLKTGLGFEASALYDMRGAASKSISNSKSIYCSSLQFPVNIRYGKNFQNIVYWFLSTGPQFGLSIGNRDHFIIAGKGKSTGHALERRWVDEKSTVSWNFGIGCVILEKVQARISYNLALKKTAEIQQIDLVDGSVHSLTNGKANAMQIAISYLF